MSGLLGILASQAPPKQDATSTIQTLCLRLSTSTLLEDRRAAVLGLRSFARDYKELVASEGLRGLIAALARDREDPETVVAVLETLWGLFERNGEVGSSWREKGGRGVGGRGLTERGRGRMRVMISHCG